jgi:transposase InsO family protein
MRVRAADERRLERCRLALDLCALLGDTPSVRRKVAKAFEVGERTLRRWAQRQRQGECLVKRRGRPPDPVPRERRQGLIALILKLGPGAGVAVLRKVFWDIPYRTIAKLKRRFVAAIRRRRGWHRKRLAWLRAGSVWASDFTHPDAPLPGPDNRLLLVRDLASGAQLAAPPCEGERASVVCSVLTTLFMVFGAPLLVKHDGGGAFRARETQALLESHDVVSLLSPPRTPQYNGSCERAGGSLKQRIAYAALAAGHPERWTHGNIAEALCQANTTAAPRGPNGPTPAQAFVQRRPVTRLEREAFKRTRATKIEEARKTHELERGTMPTCTEQAAILRKATQHALCEHGYLEFRRGRISTPVSTWKAVAKA